MRDTLVAQETAANEKGFPAAALAIAWIVITLLYKLPDPFWFLSMFSFLALLPVQLRVNKINGTVAPNQPLNSRFTWANWIWIVIGGLLFILALIGSLSPDNTPSN